VNYDEALTSANSNARLIIEYVEFHLVFTSKISSFGTIPKALHCALNLSRR